MAVIKDRLSLIRQHIPILKLLFYEAQFHPEVRKTMVEEIGVPILELLTEGIQKRQRTSEYRGLDARLAAISLVANLWGYVISEQIAPELWNMDEEEKLAQMLEIWLRGIASPRRSGGCDK